MNSELQVSPQSAVDKPELVLLHGWGIDSRIWEPVVPLLRRDFHLHLVDCPGYGQQIDGEFPTDIESLVQQLLHRLPARAAYVGWSLGGTIATWLAERHPQRVSALVTVASNPCFTRREDWHNGMTGEVFDSFVTRVEQNCGQGLRYFNALQTMGDTQSDQVQAQLQQLVASMCARETSLNNGLALLQSLDVRRQWASLSQPRLVVLGAEDQLVPVSVAEDLHALHPLVDSWTATGCGHAVMRSRPVAFAARVTDFLLQYQAGTGPVRSKRAVARSFGAATGYDKAAELQRHTGTALMQMHSPASNGRVVDLGCGNGYFVSRLRREYQAQQVIGLDLAEGMLQRARDSGAQAHWLCADAEQLPLADSSVDLLYSNLAVQWCEDLEALARECMRVLRPGGEVLLSTLGPSTLWQLRAAWRMVDRDVHVNRFAVVSELTDHFTRAGAQLHTLQVDTWTRRAATVQQVARELRQIGAHNVNPGRPLGLSGRQRWTRLAEAYASLHDSGEGLPVSWQLCFLHLQKPAVN